MSENGYFDEFHTPSEPSPPDEYQNTAEHLPLPDEYNEWQTAKDPVKSRKKISFVLYLELFAAVAVALSVHSSFGVDLLGNLDIFADVSSSVSSSAASDGVSSSPVSGTSETGDTADDAFPTLPNLMPDTYLGQAFLRFESSGGTDWLYAGAAYGLYVGDYAEIEDVNYDPDSNVLTLQNLDAPTLVLNANMMGNGFTVNLVGENRLARVLVWGYYYGGSITFTGSGSLTLNEDGDYDYGILLRSEESESCIMASPGVTLDVSGGTGAILVNASTAKKGLYYLSPLTLFGGIRSGARFLDNDGNETDVQNHTVNDIDGNPVKHIIIR